MNKKSVFVIWFIQFLIKYKSKSSFNVIEDYLIVPNVLDNIEVNFIHKHMQIHYILWKA